MLVLAGGIFGLHCGTQDLSLWNWRSGFLSGDWTQAPALRVQSLSHWTSKEVPVIVIINLHFSDD